MEDKYKIPVAAVVGPTATGKTALGIALAQRLEGEIVSCDSMQVYRGLPIGTAQPTQEELTAVPHHLVGFLDVGEPFSVSDYVQAASRELRSIHERGKLPILVGGTGLYARSLLRGFSFEENGRSEEVRRRLFQEAESLGGETLYQRLCRLDPSAGAAIHPHNVKRVVRALEYIELCGEPFSAQAERSHSAQSPYRYEMICLSFRDRGALYRRIDQRVDCMLESGLLEEARCFWNRCQDIGHVPTAAQAIGYKELFPYFQGKISLEEAVEEIKRESRRYAKRQITWFRREEHVDFLYVDDWKGDQQALLEESIRLLKKWDVLKEGLTVEQ